MSPALTAPTSAALRLSAAHAPADLSALDVEVLGVLLRSVSRTTLQTWLSQATIAARLRRCERAVRASLARLERAALIVRLKRNRPSGRISDLTTVVWAGEVERLWHAEREARRRARAPRPVPRLPRPVVARLAPPVGIVAPPAAAPPVGIVAPRVVPPRGPAEAANLAAILARFGGSPPARDAGEGTSGLSGSVEPERARRAKLERETEPAQDARALALAATFRRSLCDARGEPWRPARATEPEGPEDRGRGELRPPLASTGTSDPLQLARDAVAAMREARAASRISNVRTMVGALDGFSKRALDERSEAWARSAERGR